MTRRGMTLIEMMIALSATLLLMAAVAQVFAVFGGAISGSRAVLDLDGRMRTAAWRLRTDLAGITARTVPGGEVAATEGYLEIIEGPATDVTDAAGLSTVAGVVSGDHDDVLLFTTRNSEAPFIGRAPTVSASAAALVDTFESTVAEVAWFARPTPGSSDPVTYTVYRRQLLVMGYIGADPFLEGENTVGWSSWAGYFNSPCDVSVRREGSLLFPNTLADLSRRESRFMHNVAGLTTSGFPFPFVAHQAASTSGTAEVLPAAIEGLVFDATSQRRGEDVVLSHVLDCYLASPGPRDEQ